MIYTNNILRCESSQEGMKEGPLESKCGKICIKLKFLGQKLIKEAKLAVRGPLEGLKPEQEFTEEVKARSKGRVLS